jgi:hypothetical protein
VEGISVNALRVVRLRVAKHQTVSKWPDKYFRPPVVDSSTVLLQTLPLAIIELKSRATHGNNTINRSFGLFCFYSAVMESSKRHATFGKRIVGIFVMDVDGGRPSFGPSLLRAVAQFIPLGFLVAVLTKRRQALHDLLASTVVVPGTL